MGLFDNILGAASAIGGIGIGIGNFVGQEQNLAWQKEAQQKTWDREDTAVQRRVADLKAAGLNPVLAAGSSASTSAPIHTTAPQMDASIADKGLTAAQSVLAMMSQKANIAQSTAQAQLTQAQIDKVNSETENQRIQNTLALQQGEANLKGVQLTNDFLSSTMPDRVRAAALSNESLGIQNASRLLDIQLSRLNIDNRVVDLYRNRIGEMADRIGLDQKSTDLAAKRIAVEQARTDLQYSNFSNGYFYRSGMPKEAPLGMVGREASGLGGIVSSFADQLFNFGKH